MRKRIPHIADTLDVTRKGDYSDSVKNIMPSTSKINNSMMRLSMYCTTLCWRNNHSRKKLSQKNITEFEVGGIARATL